MRIAVLILIVVLAGCSTMDSPVASASQPAPQPAPPLSPSQVPAAAPAASISGTIAEVIDVPVYTYVRLTTPSGDVWAAIPTTKVVVGQKVTLGNPQPMVKFNSKTLNRTFDVIQFASGIVGATDPKAPVAPPHATPNTAAGNSSPLPDLPPISSILNHGQPKAADIPAPKPAPKAEPPAPKDVKVEKAAGADAKTVAELYAQKTALKDKPVAVRGKVVRVSIGILGKNWLHVRDGSGSEASKDNDLVVSTGETAEVGAILVVRGALHLDKTVGAGLTYPLLIEDAKLTK